MSLCLLRYPGSKAKILRGLLRRFPEHVLSPLFQEQRVEYREPFFGAGAVGIEVLRRLPSRASVWINDKDYGIACLWRAVVEQPGELIERVRKYTPSVDSFYELKADDGRTDRDIVFTGFCKLALHQISFSGNGAMAGGPIGGREQSSEFNVDCRWHAARHERTIRELNRLFRGFRGGVKVTSGDFDKLIVGAPAHAFIYADPPYVKAGPQLYKHAMAEPSEHQRLAESLRGCAAPWVLSYDDHPMVRELYAWAQIDSVATKYTTAIAKAPRRKNSELVITPRAQAQKGAA